jgi:uncharacterized phage protein (TIGR02218 family)
MTAKTLPGPLAAQVAAGSLTWAWFAEIIRTDAYALRLCGGTRDAVIDGDTYTASDGLTISSIASSVGLSVDNGKFTLGDSAIVLREDILDGLWDGAKYRLGQYNWASPSDGVVVWAAGWLGEAEPRLGAYDFEFRDLRQALQQDTTRVHEFACPYVLGDARCTQDLTAFTIAAVPLTSVTSTRIFAASSLAAAAGYYTEGRLLFTTGANANGIWRQIQAHATGGVMTLTRPLLRAASVADQFTIIAGCDHQPATCRDKFSNKVNYGGCDTKPSRSDIINGELAP